MPRQISWNQHPGQPSLELRIGDGSLVARYGFAPTCRSSPGPLSFSEPPALLPPGALLVGIDLQGACVSLAELQARLGADQAIVPASLILPPASPPVSAEHTDPNAAERVPAWWIPGLEEYTAGEVQSALSLVPGVLITSEEAVRGISSSLTQPLYLQRLPRVVLRPEDPLADNTDHALSMGSLLEGFVRRFATPRHTLPRICLATGYLYHHGLARVLALLQNPGILQIRLLFSGQTNRATARALTKRLSEDLGEGLDALEEPQLWTMVHEATRSGRLEVRVYTDAFLHAKVFLAHGDARHERNGRLAESHALVGSSNLTGPGLDHGGNLELNVELSDPEINTALLRWFDARWAEGAPPEPDLLTILERRRPLPTPTFETPGLDEVYRAGRRATLPGPDEHLRLLARLYDQQLHDADLSEEEIFPTETPRRIHPTEEQREGVRSLAHRLVALRLAFLADSVGLGKTITALGTADLLVRKEAARRVALIAPRKLFDQWRQDASRVGIDLSAFVFINRHKLERLGTAGALALLQGCDLLIVEEAHEALRSRVNRLWLHLRAYLATNLDARLLLVSATPWNNRREDIFNYLLLAWNDGTRLDSRYRQLVAGPLSIGLTKFIAGNAGGEPASVAVRWFAELPRETYRYLFDQAFVQRTRHALAARFGHTGDFPEREVHAHATPSSDRLDELFRLLASTLDQLFLPYRQPGEALLITAAAMARDEAESPASSNLRASAVTQLYKRAESSVFALAVSLATVERQLRALRDQIERLCTDDDPPEALRQWLGALLDAASEEDPEDELSESLFGTPASETRADRIVARLEPWGVANVLRRLIETQIDPDLAALAPLRASLDLALDEDSPKDLLLSRLARDATASRHKPILIAGFADTAMRMFIRLLSMIPEARIGLALGGGEAWIYEPGSCRRAPLGEEEWTTALSLDPVSRRERLLGRSQRARPAKRDDVLNAFAPIARGITSEQLLRLGGELDVLIGSEAISIGQNLQDSSALIQLDLPWNPMVIEQRIGRIDRRGGGREEGGRKVVDIHYCWSIAAIEAEVDLRRRLRDKAGGAMDDTNYDELLLSELFERVTAARELHAREAAAASVLDQRQRALAEAQSDAGGLPSTAGSDLDALAALAAWREQAADAPAPDPVVAAGFTPSAASGGVDFLVTVALTPLGPGGVPVTGGELIVSLPLTLGQTDLLPSLEAVVRRLIDGGDPAPRPARRAWIEALLQVDLALQGLRARSLREHNEAADARTRAALEPRARRTASDKLGMLVVEASQALKEEIERKRRAQDAAAMAFARAEGERLRFLLGEVLKAERASELLADHSEEAAGVLLRRVRDFPERVFGEDFSEIFDALCGRRYAAGRGGEEQQQLALATREARWTDLKIRVLAATWAAR